MHEPPVIGAERPAPWCGRHRRAQRPSHTAVGGHFDVASTPALAYRPLMRTLFAIALVFAAVTPSHPVSAQAATPAAVADELLAADRAFATAARDRDLVTALSAQFHDDVAMTWPKGFAWGRAAAEDALRSNPANATSRASWNPVRVGISADGRHGFTFGTMTTTLADGTVRPGKYMTYWIKRDGVWKAAAYKRAPAGAGDPPAMMPPSLPDRLVPPSTDKARNDALVEGLRAAEQSFSDEAQKIGVGPAFKKFGHPDAVNMGAPDTPGFVVGADAIGGGMGTGPTTITWNAERALVASSGDLGVTFGYIRLKDGSREPIPFFTIWRRDSPSSPWRYIAE